MKIVILNGSPRKNGATARILKRIENIMKVESSAEIETIHLIDKEIQTCRGCTACYKTGGCFLQDEADSISEKLRRADGIIIGTPTYVSNISGLLKTFIDRGHFVVEQLLRGKQVFHVVTYENAGAGTAMKILDNLSIFSGATVSSKLKVKNEFNHNPLNSLKIDNKVVKETSKFIDAVKKQKKIVYQSMIHSIVFNIGIRPFVLKKKEAYQGVIASWNAM